MGASPRPMLYICLLHVPRQCPICPASICRLERYPPLSMAANLSGGAETCQRCVCTIMLYKSNLSRFELNLQVLFVAVEASQQMARSAARLNLSVTAVRCGLVRLQSMLNSPCFCMHRMVPFPLNAVLHWQALTQASCKFSLIQSGVKSDFQSLGEAFSRGCVKTPIYAILMHGWRALHGGFH
jgi:hypothetical protein